MKSKMAWFWFFVSLVLGALLIVETREGRARKQTLEQLQLQLENGKTQAEARVRELEQEQAKTRGEKIALENELASTRLAYTSLASMTNSPGAVQNAGASRGAQTAAGANVKNPAAFMSDMLKNPETRKLMEGQQKMALDMMYGSLTKRLQLSPDAEKQFKQILLDQQMENLSQAGALLDVNSPDRAAAMQQLADKRKEREDQIHELLGDDKFAQYQNYNQTIGERFMLDQFGKEVQLTPDQTESLLGIMGEEKKNAQINTGMQGLDKSAEFQKVMKDPAGAEKLFTQQEQVNQRVLDRAGQILSAEQLEKLGPILKNQLDMQKAGMKMARQMFGGSDAGPGSPPVPVPAK